MARESLHGSELFSRERHPPFKKWIRNPLRWVGNQLFSRDSTFSSAGREFLNGAMELCQYLMQVSDAHMATKLNQAVR